LKIKLPKKVHKYLEIIIDTLNPYTTNINLMIEVGEKLSHFIEENEETTRLNNTINIEKEEKEERQHFYIKTSQIQLFTLICYLNKGIDINGIINFLNEDNKKNKIFEYNEINKNFKNENETKLIFEKLSLCEKFIPKVYYYKLNGSLLYSSNTRKEKENLFGKQELKRNYIKNSSTVLFSLDRQTQYLALAGFLCSAIPKTKDRILFMPFLWNSGKKKKGGGFKKGKIKIYNV